MILLMTRIRIVGKLPSSQSEREGEAPTALLAEGATQAPIIVRLLHTLLPLSEPNLP
jgi:hypothetical protein